MGQEQRKFNSLRYAYNPEAQQIAVQEAQVKGLLVKEIYRVSSREIRKVSEAGLEWYAMGNCACLLSNDCDELTLNNLMFQRDSLYDLTLIVGDFRPDVCFDRNDRIVAGVFYRGRSIYPPSQKTTTLVVDECDSLLRRDVARWEFRRITPPKL